MTSGSDLRFLEATSEDFEWCWELNQLSYREIVTRQFGDWDDNFQRQNFIAKWQEIKFQKIIVGGDPAGIISLQKFTDYWQLREIQVLPQCQGQGLGTAVLKTLMAQARDAGLPLRLRVLHLNRAKDLYERLGFLTTGKTETHYTMEFWARV